MRIDSPLNASTEANSFLLFVDESLSSWKRRNPSLRHAVKVMPCSFRDEDFGQLQLKVPIIDSHLFSQLQRAAESPDPWVLSPRAKQICPRCLIEGWVSGRPTYARRSWRIAWRACCPEHGLYEPLKSDWKRSFRFPLQYLSRPSWNGLNEICFHARHSQWTKVVLGKNVRIRFFGRRGLHIQNALEGQTHRQQWYPHKIEPSLFRHTYASVVKALMRQFDLDLEFSIGGQVAPPTAQRRLNRFKAPTWKDLGLFYQFDPRQRCSLNVLVEAILAVVTDSPLPGDVGAHRCTEELVHAINWEHGPPGTPAGVSPFESLMRLVQADLRASARVVPSFVAAPHHVEIRDLDPRRRIREMRDFYRRKYAQAQAQAQAEAEAQAQAQAQAQARGGARDKPLEVSAGRDLRERDNN